MIRFTPSPVTLQAADGEGKREIMGVAAPYNVVATVADGTEVKFLPGSLPVDGPAPKLIQNHDLTAAIGVVTERVEDENGMYFVARISKTAAGNDALELAKDGVLDAVSVGAEPVEFERDENGVLVVAMARWIELSLVPLGAFPQARVTQVAAQKAEENNMSEIQNTAKVETVAAEAPAPAPTAPVWAVKAEREFPMPTAGEYLAAYHIGGETWRNVNAAYKQNVAKKQTAIQAALAQDLTADTPGLLPTPVLGPVFQDINFLRPVVNAIGVRSMPNGNGKSFIRPTFSQHTATGTQTEGSAVTSQKATIASNSVTRTTVAGGVFISQQDIDFTDPAALQAILNDLAGQYLMKTDDVACDNLVSAASTGGVWPGTAVTLMETIYSSAQDISTGTNLFPTHIVASINTWRKFGELVDNQDRPIFPFVGQPGLNGQNTLGAGGAANWSQINPLGLAMVVDTNVAANTFVILHAPAYEIYENVRGIMTVEDPELLGRNFTYYGYFATFLAKNTLARKWTHS